LPYSDVPQVEHLARGGLLVGATADRGADLLREVDNPPEPFQEARDDLLRVDVGPARLRQVDDQPVGGLHDRLREVEQERRDAGTSQLVALRLPPRLREVDLDLTGGADLLALDRRGQVLGALVLLLVLRLLRDGLRGLLLVLPSSSSELVDLVLVVLFEVLVVLVLVLVLVVGLIGEPCP
jgi:hypothetical protein